MNKFDHFLYILFASIFIFGALVFSNGDIHYGLYIMVGAIVLMIISAIINRDTSCTTDEVKK